MPQSKYVNGQSPEPSERTPLLDSTVDPPNTIPEASAIETQDAQVVQQAEGGSAQSSSLPNANNDSQGQQNDVRASRRRSKKLAKFGQNGRLEGIGEWNFRFILGGILTGYFIAMFDSTLMASSHPVITSYFNASNSASWLSTAFLLTFTSLQPLIGGLSDTFGRRPLYLFGLVMLSAATAWCALAQSIGSFIAARAFCGVGAAALMSQGTIIINDLVSIGIRGKYQAYINIFYGGGSACGAAFGGFLCDRLGWRNTFALQVPILLVLLLNAIFSTPASLGPNLAKKSGMSVIKAMKGFDIAGSILLTVSVSFLVLGLNLGGNVYPWKHPIIVTSLAVALVGGMLLMRVESRASRPILPLSMMFSQPRGNLVFNNFFAQVGINTILFNAPLYFQAVKLETPSVSGFRLGGPTVALMICGVSAGFIISATGSLKWLVVVGSLSLLLGAIGLSAIWDDIPTWLATIFIIPIGIGQGLAFPAVSIAVLATSAQEEQATMTTTLSLWRFLGVAMGVSISSLILQNSLAAYLQQLVTGDEKQQIIEQVRKSVRSIIDLDPTHQSQVINAYKQSLRLVFISAIIFFVIVNALIFTIKLPNLKTKKRVAAEEEGGEEDSDSSSYDE